MFKICEIPVNRLVKTDQKFLIYGVSDPEQPEDHSIIFVKEKLNESYQQVKESVFITRDDLTLAPDPSSIQLRSSRPKNLYGALLKKLEVNLKPVELKPVNGSYLSEDLKMGKNVKIAPFCVIGRDVEIGDNCEIGAGTVIRDHVRIGREVQIKEHCVIGAEDADIYRPDGGACKTLPHLAGTIIEDGCLLLAGSVLAAGDTRTTVLKKGAMIGLLGDVGHNCRIGEDSLISGKASISGHCSIGRETYVAPMAVTMNRIEIGAHAYLGLGAVALKDIPEGEKQFGNPARRVLGDRRS